MSLLCEDMIPIVAQPSSLRSGNLDRRNHPLQPITSMPHLLRFAATRGSTVRGGPTMALSEFPRLGFDPFVELRRMQTEMSRLSSGFSATTARDFPPINIWLGENSVVVTAELPGVTRDDVTISLQEDVLTLEGKREPKVQEDNVNWQRRERAYGTFSRTVQLPFRVDADKVQAHFNNGILEIELQRLEADRPKKIEIRAA
jgi:HSP20 family protein